MVLKGGSERHRGVLLVRGPRTFEFRRSERVPVTIPITVSGTQKGASFRETANTLNVSAHGALISVANPLEERQDVLVTNLKSLKSIQGEVVWVKRIAGGKSQVGIQFTKLSPLFWDISPPPED